MKTRRFVNLDFAHVGQIEPERGVDDAFLELMPQAKYKDATTTPLNPYGGGPFCKFRAGRGLHLPGLYVLTVDEGPVYAGECVDLGKRWGPNGYGGISPRNCFQGGQPTNCRVNASILSSIKDGRRLDLWFCALEGSTEERKTVETALIQSLAPQWNRAKMIGVTP